MSTQALVVQWRVKPGRLEDFLALAKEWKPVLEANGCKRQRIWQGGPGPGDDPMSLISWVGEWDSGTEYGTSMDKLERAPQQQTLLKKATAPDGPATVAQVLQITELEV